MARAELLCPPWTRCPTPAFLLALVVGAAGAGPGPLWAQGGGQIRGAQTGGAPPTVESDAPPGSHLQVSLMTIGPGDIYWERFSHNALVIRDDRAQTEAAYNWGMFDFNEEGFWPRLA